MSDSPGEPTTSRSRRRPRGLVACRRCKARKQRCDNKFPACSSCLDSGENCTYGAKQAYPAEYVRSLERKVARLEDEATTSRQVAGISPTGGASISRKDTLPTESTQFSFSEPNATGRDNPSSDLEASAGIVAPSPDAFLGVSSGYPLTKLLRSALHQSTDNSVLGYAKSPNEVRGLRSSSRSIRGHLWQADHSDQTSQTLDMPSEQVSLKLIDAYYARVHPKHPFLPRNRVLQLHHIRNDLIPAHKAMQSGSTDITCACAILQLVYAIGARYLQLTNDDDYSSPSVGLRRSLYYVQLY